jgi:hypothetical protein
MNFMERSAKMPRERTKRDNLISEEGALSPLVKRLLAVARNDDRRVMELCDAVLRQDWDAATTVARLLSRKLQTPSSAALPSMQARPPVNKQNCA